MSSGKFGYGLAWVILLLLGLRTSAETLPVTATPPATQAELPPDLASVMEAKASAYARRALSFTCIERMRETTYSDDKAGDDRVREHEFLMVRDDTAPEGLRGLRTRVGSRGQREEQVDFPFPEPQLWPQIFRAQIRSTLRFGVGHWRTTPYKLAIPIAWASAAPAAQGRRVSEWSGTIDVEYRTGNVVRIVARPNLQEERIQAELSRYLTAFRVLGLSAAPPARGLELTVDYLFEHEGFSYPTRIELRTFQQTHKNERETISRRVVEYRDYRFFGTATEERIPPLEFRAEDDPNDPSLITVPGSPRR